jgi:hypothetical protein
MQPESLPEQAPHNHCLQLEVADIFRAHGKHYRDAHPISTEHLKVMRDIEQCRTASLGGHVDVCENDCGYFNISYNSCRNRHCPKCQGLQKIRWVEQRLERLLPTHYFHIVVTLPHELNALVLYNKPLMYTMLFHCASHALLDCALNWKRFGARIGFTAVLHTWNQDLSFHPHLHIIATGGGLDDSQSRWISSKTNFLVPVRLLSRSVRDLFCHVMADAFEEGKIAFPDSLSQLGSPEAFQRFLRKRRRQKWVVYCKKPFGGPEQFIAYVGRYTHRVAISNHRLLHFSNARVAFKARDNSDPSKHRVVMVSAEEFIRRFLLHVLPTGFVRIRHYGLMAACNAKTKLLKARDLIKPSYPPMDPVLPETSGAESKIAWQDLLHRVTGIDPCLCPRCGARTIPKPLTILENLTWKEGTAIVNSS